MPETPPNSATASATLSKPSSSPVSAKVPDRQKGIANYRERIEDVMMNEGRYAQMPVQKFMDKFLPKSSTAPPFNEADAVINDMQYFEPERREPVDEKKCYAPLVSFMRASGVVDIDPLIQHHP